MTSSTAVSRFLLQLAQLAFVAHQIIPHDRIVGELLRQRQKIVASLLLWPSIVEATRPLKPSEWPNATNDRACCSAPIWCFRKGTTFYHDDRIDRLDWLRDLVFIPAINREVIPSSDAAHSLPKKSPADCRVCNCPIEQTVNRWNRSENF